METHKTDLSVSDRAKLNKNPTHSFILAVRKTGTNILDLTKIKNSLQMDSNVRHSQNLRKEVQSWFDTIKIYFIQDNNRLFYCTNNKVTEISFKKLCEIFYSYLPELTFRDKDFTDAVAHHINKLKHDLQKRIIELEKRKTD